MAEADLPVAPDAALAEPPELPGRPARPQLVPPGRVTARGVGTRQGRGALLHALAHIEFNAINLALDAVWRFPAMPIAFYLDWTRVAAEEAGHFALLCERLQTLDYVYGDFPAHDGLWEMAHKTRLDVLARLALVPRTLEARGLDASPLVRVKFAAVGDAQSAALIDRILRDEIGHVAAGNFWYRYVCEQRGIDPVRAFEPLMREFNAPRLRGPFNLEARRAAGFTPIELDALHSL